MTVGIKPRLVTLSWLTVAALPAWGYGSGYHYGSGMMYGGGGIIGWLLTILIIVLVVAVALGAMRWIFVIGRHRPTDSQAPHKSALEILEERFAQGEIDKNEFEEKRKTLVK